MNNLDTKTKSIIEVLCNRAVPEIKQYDLACDSKTFSKLGRRYGPLAYKIYKTLDSQANPIYLDPWLVYNRFRSADGGLPDTPAFWNHADAVIGLVKALERMDLIPKELKDGSA